MKKVKSFLVLLILGMAIIGCNKKSSSDIDPEIPFYQDYKVIYRKYKNLTKAKATFREKNKNGIRLELQPPAKILCNGKPSSFSNAGNYFYNWQFSGNENAYFQLTDNKSRIFNNSILLHEINDIGFPDSFNTVNLDGTTALNWTGTPLQEGEFVMATIYQGDKFSGNYYIDSIGSTSIELTKDLMFDLTPGNAELILSRETHIENVTNPDGDAGGRRIIVVETKKTIILN